MTAPKVINSSTSDLKGDVAGKMIGEDFNSALVKVIKDLKEGANLGCGEEYEQHRGKPLSKVCE